ncbi:hypothetical protein RD792_002996 [Penstemon davidsonii]|uniref:Uncharacterized protein n=1 Tax=Penstemon davidsonii TaxID=160366 RepID=A0ABR0DSK2_9LAMI|nr:hypothetical protein RD792_002996 [Penstemon davidsonii]
MASPDKQPTAPCHVVAMPYPGRGHINPMLDLCTALAENIGEILVTFVVTEEWLGLIGSVSKPPNISFATIPNVVPSEKVRGDDNRGFAMAVMSKMEEPFDRLLGDLELKPAVIIAGAFLHWAANVANRRNIPLAYMWTMSASVYTIFYHFDLLVQNGHFPVNLSVVITSNVDVPDFVPPPLNPIAVYRSVVPISPADQAMLRIQAPLRQILSDYSFPRVEVPLNGDDIVDYIPGLPPLLVADLPQIIRDQESISALLKIIPQESKSNYLLFSSIYELESQVFDILKKKSAFSIYNISPATSYSKVKNTINNSNKNDENIFKWLNLQSPNSVLYISQGSFRSVSRTHMDEIAIGLCSSGVRFLWIARNETTRLQEICGEKGLVVDWCDQLSVLCHSSVGGFWTHCGWNSTKEALLAGVPMLTLPIGMDQVTNAKAIVEDWRVGWRVKREFDEGDLMRMGEIKELLLRFMDLESLERKEISRNARELQKICEREFADGQSFQINLNGFTKSILQHRSI